MRKFVALAILLLAASTFALADAVSGSLPFVFVDTTGNGNNLLTTTELHSPTTLTSGAGTGDFAGIPVLTLFGSMVLNNLTVGTGGGFVVSNPLYGSFVAFSGTIISRSPSFLNVEMDGIFIPGPGLSRVGGSTLTASLADADVSFNQTGNSVSGSFTMSTVPEPVALALFGSGLMLCGFWVRRAR